MTDLFYQFVDLYEKGDILQALQVLIPSPDIAYENLHSTIKIFPYLINYADACVFRGGLEMYETNEALRLLLKEDPKLRVIHENFLHLLKTEAYASQVYYHENKPSIQSSNIIEERRMHVWQRWHEFQKIKPNLARVWGGAIHQQPWYPFVYPISANIIQIERGSEILLFADLFDTPIHKKPHWIVCETISAFFQLLTIDSFFNLLIDTHIVIYILELYPQEQLQAQISFPLNKNLRPMLLTKKQPLLDIVELWTDVLEKYLREGLAADANWLYKISQRYLFRLQVERYGSNRYLALTARQSLMEWYDPHKGHPPSDAYLGPLPPDYNALMIRQAQEKRVNRIFQPDYKVRLVHIVPQIVDGSHAPSRLLRNLVLNANQQWFETFVICTERLAYHPFEYPSAAYVSRSSLERGAYTLNLFKHQGIHCIVLDQPYTYLSTILQITEIIKQLKIDIAVFHGPDQINELSSAMSDVPLRIFFDHGSLPHYSCFDLLILSSEELLQVHRESFLKMGMESCALPYCVDVRADWQEKPYSKEELGLPSQAFIMTTISNHLSHRLSIEMCQAIATILKRCPQAIYAPIGMISHPEKFYDFFEQHHVRSQVIFLGHRETPSQYVRSMNLYLNEFPFGSGLTILEAMAAGCPIVSMYVENGPPQAKYGATYFGKEWVITSGQPQDYVDLACRLIQDPDLYQIWSQHALEQYEKHANVQQYVYHFEKILEKFIEFKEKHINK